MVTRMETTGEDKVRTDTMTVATLVAEVVAVEVVTDREADAVVVEAVAEVGVAVVEVVEVVIEEAMVAATEEAMETLEVDAAVVTNLEAEVVDMVVEVDTRATGGNFTMLLCL